MSSARQQSDLLRSIINKNQIAASPLTLIHHREKAVTVCKNFSNTATVIELCCNGCVARGKGRYTSIFGQFTDGNNQKHENVMTVKSFPKNTPVSAKSLFNTISKEACSNFPSQVCSILVDTISLNTRKKGCS